MKLEKKKRKRKREKAKVKRRKMVCLKNPENREFAKEKEQKT